METMTENQTEPIEQAAPETTPETTPRKWTTTAGPRITKKVTELLRKLQWAGKGKVELTGTIGKPETERRAILTSLFSTALSEPCLKAFAEIGQKYDYTITPKNHDALSADLIAAIKTVEALRPVEDLRKTPEQNQAERIERNQREQERQAKAAEQQAVDAVEIEKLKKEFPYLETSDTSPKSRHALVGANIRKILAKEFPGHVFTVRTESFSGGNSCDVGWIDGPTEKEVKELIWRFESGNFDGMTDCYDYRADVFHDLFGSIKYLGTNRHYTPERFLAEGEKQGITVHLYDSGGLHHEKMDRQDIYLIQHAIADTSYYVRPEPAAVQGGAVQDAGDCTYGGDPQAVIYRLNQEKGGIELKFPEKPSADMICALKAAGWRWSRFNLVWYTKHTPRAEEFAKRITGVIE